MKNFICFKSKIGNIFIAEENKKITNISFSKISGICNETKLLKLAKTQITEYLNGIRKTFDLPIKFNGTKFQTKVWNELLKIPYGKTASYKEIATKIGNKNSFRAVGNANNKNKLLILIPCHRIIKTDGTLGGYAGTIEIKKKLLDLEFKNHFTK